MEAKQNFLQHEMALVSLSSPNKYYEDHLEVVKIDTVKTSAAAY